MFYATIGLYTSWLLNRTIYSIMAAYTVVIGGLVVTTGIVAGLAAMILGSVIDDPFSKFPFMWVNPIMMVSEAMDPKGAPNTMLFLVYGLIVYLVLTLLIIWRMSVGFRRFAYAN
jgi:hypothetical protein